MMSIIEKLRAKASRDLLDRIEELENSVRLQAEMLYEARVEVAKEIFEEIYEDCFDQFGFDYEKLIELKKKYTKDGEQK